MKIIFTVNTYYPLKDGVQAVTQYLAEGLAKKHDVIVITGRHGLEKSEDSHKGVNIRRIEAYTKHTIHKGNKKEYLQVLFNEIKSADVLISVCTQTPLTDWVLSKIDDVKCTKILYMHGMIDFKYKPSDFSSISKIISKLWNNIRWKLYYSYYENRFRAYDVISQLHKYDDAYLYFSKKEFNNLAVIENAADDEFFHEVQKDKLSLPKRYILCVNNYIERKNQELCLNAFYKAESNDYEMIFIGSSKTSYYDRLIDIDNKLRKQYGVKKVKFLTDVPRSHIPAYVKNSQIYIIGSKWEAYPISIIEAMASGVPFISTDVGVVKHLPGGIIVRSEDEMVTAINRLISDVKYAKELGTTGFLYAEENFKISKKVTQLEQIITNKKRGTI